MTGTYLSVQNCIGSRLKLSAVYIKKISRAVADRKNLLLNFCVILSRWQLKLGFKKKILLDFFSFFVPHICTFKCRDSCGCADFDLYSKIPKKIMGRSLTNLCHA